MKKYTAFIKAAAPAAFLLTAFLLPLPAAAPDDGLKKISVEDALRIALENNRDYSIALGRMGQAREKVNAAWGQLMPALESEAALTRQYAENGFMSLSDGQYDIKFAQLRFGINPGVFYNSLQLTKKAYVVAKEEVRRVRSDIEYRVIESYFNLLLAAEMTLLRNDSLEVLKSNLRDVENLYKTGSVPKLELLQARVQYRSQEPLVLEAESNRRVALDIFNYTLGSDRPAYTVDAKVLENAVRAVSRDDGEVKREALTALALKNRPEIIQIEKKREIAGHGENAAGSYYLWPTFSVGGYYGMTKYQPNPVDVGLPPGPVTPDFSQISGSDRWQRTWQVRMAATYRWGALFPTDPSRALEREEKLKVKEAEEELLKLKRFIAISISLSYSKLGTAYLTILSQRENVQTAREGLRIARESYRAGVIKNADLLAAELSLTNARTGYINAVNAYYTALAALKRETGADIDTIILEDKK
ncbi:MAG TPA: TolC family protein [Spirochaetes bacterium]|nr:TolC family protein [Spirochaetota bacterium]